MAIQWNDYIYPLTDYVRAALGVDDTIKLLTAPMEDEAHLAVVSEILPALEWDPDSTLYRSESGFIAKVRYKNRRFLILSSDAQILRAEGFVESFGTDNGMDLFAFDDAFFLFCVKNVQTRLRNGFDVATLRATLTFDEKRNKKFVDYVETRNALVPIYTWEIKNELASENFVLQYILECESGEVPTLECIGLNNLNFDIDRTCRSVDLANVARVLARPILQHIDQLETPVRVAIDEPHKFLPMFEGIKIARQDIVFRAGGGIFFRYELNTVQYFGLSMPNIINENTVIDYLESLLVIYIDLREHERLALAYHLSGYLGLRTQFLESPDQLADLPGVSVHSIEIDLPLINHVFDDILVFDLSKSSMRNLWEILLKLATNFPRLSSPFVSNDLRAIALTLSNTDGVVAENVYLSLTASHWKHSFLEAFRLIEGLYYFGWMNKLKASLRSPLTEYELALHCKGDLSWKSKELPSIQHLFALVPEHILSGVEMESIISIRPKLSEAADHVAKMRAFAAAIYSVRNSGVHQGEHETEAKILVSADCWPKLTEYLLRVVLFFYSDAHYRLGMPR